MHTQQDVCHICGEPIEENRDAKLNECCSSQWVKQQIDNCYL